MAHIIIHIKFRFCDDVELMLGQRPGLFWRLCWQYIRFVLMITILVLPIFIFERKTICC